MSRVIPIRPVKGDTNSLTDAALVAACASGDQAAFAALFDRHHEAVYRFLARLSGVDAQDLDDLLQVTFEKVIGAAPRYRGDAAVRTWLFSIAANAARTHVRTDSRRKRRLHAVREPLSRPPTDPSVSAERVELMERLRIALGELPHKLRVVFVMCDVEDVPGVDAAKALGLRTGTLYRRLHDARRQLRTAINERVR